MARQRTYLWLGDCSENVLIRKYGEPLVGYIEQNSPEDMLLHQKARDLDDENYLQDWAAELNADYFNNELDFELVWSHKQTATGGNSKGRLDCWHGKVIAGGRIAISYRLAEHAYTDNENCVEYMLMHEMAHQLEMNHWHSFWMVVARNPNAVEGYTNFHGKPFPIQLKPHTLPTADVQYADSRRNSGGYLATGGYKQGETIKANWPCL